MGAAYVFFANYTKISEFVMSFFHDGEPQTSET